MSQKSGGTSDGSVAAFPFAIASRGVAEPIGASTQTSNTNPRHPQARRNPT